MFIDELSSHAEMLICSEVHLPHVSSRKLSWKRGGRVRMAQASKVSLAPGGSSEGRRGRQVARRKVVSGARRLVGRASWAPGGPSAVMGARSPVRRLSWAPVRRPFRSLVQRPSGPLRTQVFLQFCCKMQVLRRLQAGRRQQAAGRGGPSRKVTTPLSPTA